MHDLVEPELFNLLCVLRRVLSKHLLGKIFVVYFVFGSVAPFLGLGEAIRDRCAEAGFGITGARLSIIAVRLLLTRLVKKQLQVVPLLLLGFVPEIFPARKG